MDDIRRFFNSKARTSKLKLPSKKETTINTNTISSSTCQQESPSQDTSIYDKTHDKTASSSQDKNQDNASSCHGRKRGNEDVMSSNTSSSILKKTQVTKTETAPHGVKRENEDRIMSKPCVRKILKQDENVNPKVRFSPIEKTKKNHFF